MIFYNEILRIPKDWVGVTGQKICPVTPTSLEKKMRSQIRKDCETAKS